MTDRPQDPPETDDPLPLEDGSGGASGAGEDSANATTGSGALDALADQMFEKIREESDRSEPARGGLDWIRSTLRSGGADEDPLIGTLFQEKYRILRRIGKGGFGAVYEAVDERGAKNRVALKIQLPGFTQSEKRREMFRNEAMRVTRLNHPNIVDWKSFDVTPDGGSYFVMELLDGVELSEELKREGPLDCGRAMTLMLQILEALVAAHFLGKGQSILHLDLKPRNIFLLPENEHRPEQIKVIDFGIGQFLGGDGPPALPPSDSVTDVPSVPAEIPVEKGTMTAVSTHNTETFRKRASKYDFEISQAYTAEYASPEQCGHIAFALGSAKEPVPLDGRSDLYSFGVIAYELLTGRLPFKAPHIRELWLSIHQETPILPWGDAEAKVPPPLRAFVERCLEKDRDDRFADSREALATLRRIATPRATWRYVAAAALLLFVGGITAFYLFNEPDGELSLQTEGQELVAHHLGPDSDPWLIDVSAQGALIPRRVAANLLVVDKDQVPLVGWQVESTDNPLTIRVRPTEAFLANHPGRATFERVRIESKNGIWTSDPFDFTWLGAESASWQAHLGGVPVQGETPALLDPEGLVFEVHFPGLAIGDLNLESWRIQPAEDQGAIERLGNGDGTGARLRVPLGPMAPSTTQLVLWGQDNSGRELRIAVPIQVASEALSVEVELQTPNQDRRHPWDPAGTPRVFLRQDEDILWITTNRPSRITSPLPWLTGTTQVVNGRDRFSVSLKRWFQQEARLGSNDLEIQVTDLVMHEPRIREAAHTREIQLDHLVTEAASVRWQVTGDPAPAVFAGRPGPRPVSSGQELVWLKARERMDLSRYRIQLQVGGESARSIGPFAAQREVNLTPYLGKWGMGQREGIVPIRVTTFLADSSGQESRLSRLDHQDLELMIDRTAPAFDQLVPSLEVIHNFQDRWRLRLEDPEDGGSEILVSWQLNLKRTDATVLYGDVAPQIDEQGRRFFEVDPFPTPRDLQALRDGTYILIVHATDRAGNQARVVEREGEIARTGPDLKIKSPNPVGYETQIEWATTPDQKLEPVQVSAFDYNGVADEGVVCFVYRESDPFIHGRQSGYELTSPTRTGNVWSWEFDPPPTWSRAEDVYIQFEARDRMGRPCQARVIGPVRMPAIAQEYPPRIGNMLLIPGNSGGTYTFMGRTSLVSENRCFEDAGFERIWVSPGREKPGVAESAWGLDLPPDSIRPYYLSEREVTVGEFHEFLIDPEGYYGHDNWPPGSGPTNERWEELTTDLGDADPTAPMDRVWQREAQAYANYRGMRLPSLLELTYAIRGGPERYRARSWDAEDEQHYDPDDPFSRVRGLSRNAEWTMSPVELDPSTGLPMRPQDARAFLPSAGPNRELTESYWIQGNPRGFPARTGANARTDFGAVDHAPAEGWLDGGLGFRLAWDADVASEATLRNTGEGQ